MKHLLRSVPTLLLIASILTVAHLAQPDVSGKTIVRTAEAQVPTVQTSCGETASQR